MRAHCLQREETCLRDCERLCRFSVWVSGRVPFCLSQNRADGRVGGRAGGDGRGGSGSEAVKRPPLCCQTVEVEVQGGKSGGNQAGLLGGGGGVDINPSTNPSPPPTAPAPHPHTHTHRQGRSINTSSPWINKKTQHKITSLIP